MADPMNDDLVGRLEKASGPDRQIDREIAKAIDPTIWKRATNWASMPCGAPADIIERDAIRWVPAYTESLDAALALAERVLPGWHWAVSRTNAILLDPEEVTETIVNVSKSAPALALCIAILKARPTADTATHEKSGGDK